MQRRNTYSTHTIIQRWTKSVQDESMVVRTSREKKRQLSTPWMLRRAWGRFGHRWWSYTSPGWCLQRTQGLGRSRRYLRGGRRRRPWRMRTRRKKKDGGEEGCSADGLKETSHHRSSFAHSCKGLGRSVQGSLGSPGGSWDFGSVCWGAAGSWRCQSPDPARASPCSANRHESTVIFLLVLIRLMVTTPSVSTLGVSVTEALQARVWSGVLVLDTVGRRSGISTSKWNHKNWEWNSKSFQLQWNIDSMSQRGWFIMLSNVTDDPVCHVVSPLVSALCVIPWWLERWHQEPRLSFRGEKWTTWFQY